MLMGVTEKKWNIGVPLKENYNVEQLKRDAENPFLNTLSKASSAFFLACQRPIGIFLQS